MKNCRLLGGDSNLRLLISSADVNHMTTEQVEVKWQIRMGIAVGTAMHQRYNMMFCVEENVIEIFGLLQAARAGIRTRNSCFLVQTS